MTKRKKIRLIIIGGILLVIAILFLRVYFFFNAKPTIAVNYAAEWNRQTQQEHYDANQNAYFDYEKAAGHLKEVPLQIQTDPDRSFEFSRLFNSSSGSRNISGTYPIEIGISHISIEWPSDMNDSELGILRQWLADNEAAVKLLRQGAQKPYYWHKMPEYNIKMWEIERPLLKWMNECLQVLIWRAKMEAFDNKQQEAIEDLSACFNIAGHLVSQRSSEEQQQGIELTTMSVRSTIETLANAKIEEDILSEFHRKLLQKFSEQKKKFDLTGEKIAAYDILQHIFTDDGKGSGHFIPKEYKKIRGGGSYPSGLLSPGSSMSFQSIGDFFANFFEIMKENGELARYAVSGHSRRQTVEMLESYIRHLGDLQNISPRQRQQNPPDNKIDELLKNYLIFSCYCGSYYASENWHKYKTEESALLTIIALLLYKSRNGVFPESLNELADAGFLLELPQDPYSDGPLVYKKDGDNFKFYSLGPDFTDDEGLMIRDDYTGKIQWWDHRGDTVFWPYPKETAAERQDRIKQTGSYFSFGSSEIPADVPDIINDVNIFQR